MYVISTSIMIKKFSTDMQHDLYGAQRRIWNFIRSQKKLVNEQIVVNITSEEWKSLYNTEEQADLCTITNNIHNYIINKKRSQQQPTN